MLGIGSVAKTCGDSGSSTSDLVHREHHVRIPASRVVSTKVLRDCTRGRATGSISVRTRRAVRSIACRMSRIARVACSVQCDRASLMSRRWENRIMKIRKCSFVLAPMLGLLFAGVSFAGDAKSFDELDTNEDGQLSKTEASMASGIDFAKADTDRNGMLSRTEYEKAMS
ncbi:MAG: EF-hand domain-containing protein [Myxococcota bacterium]